MAEQLLEHNTLNRPLSDGHVQRIARQILSDKWKFNGDTIKVANTGDVLDGQHRLWAVIMSKRSIETILVRGIDRDAFATIDTLRRSRSGGDTLAVNGATRHRKQIAMALTWLIRWQREVLETFRAPLNKVENSDIEECFHIHPKMAQAVERASPLRRVVNVSLMAFIYYVFSNHNHDIAERMINTLENPAGVGINDPFFRLRTYFIQDHGTSKDPLMTVALAIKAANAAYNGREVSTLFWRNSGKAAEDFPQLAIGRPHEKRKT